MYSTYIIIVYASCTVHILQYILYILQDAEEGESSSKLSVEEFVSELYLFYVKVVLRMSTYESHSCLLSKDMEMMLAYSANPLDMQVTIYVYATVNTTTWCLTMQPHGAFDFYINNVIATGIRLVMVFSSLITLQKQSLYLLVLRFYYSIITLSNYIIMEKPLLRVLWQWYVYKSCK